MNTLQKSLLALASASLLSVSAHAAAPATQGYLGLKGGLVMLDDDSTVDIDDAAALGVYGGYNFNPNVAIEAEYVASEDADISAYGIKGEYNVEFFGMYGVYRHYFPNSPVYGKGKLGFVRAKTEASVMGFKESDTDTEIAGGLGLGFAATPNIDIEGEFSLMGGDADGQMLSIGAAYKF
ncbi:porin family protein [Psychrobacter sanguinis]|uniref:Outer membrane beta-barrel protein n=1 Tax=Psychrobacter sanguinis TaxID=861445 RepID=A0A844M3R1_9GAMM|nr:porin family protein [Psychrobacter sanguinis]MUG33453.1 outer membrane beta-barrel protein [Psychrobacter sanguinis]